MKRTTVLNFRTCLEKTSQINGIGFYVNTKIRRFWELCRWKGINILEAEVCVDHVHMLIEIPPKMSVSGVMGFLKGKSSLMIYERWGNMKYKYRNRQFWCRGYYVDTTGKNTKKIIEYIANQLNEDRIAEQMTLEESTCSRVASRRCKWQTASALWSAARITGLCPQM